MVVSDNTGSPGGTDVPSPDLWHSSVVAAPPPFSAALQEVHCTTCCHDNMYLKLRLLILLAKL